jgi:hypothetical protein
MHIRKTRAWELPDSAVTPEADYLRRREFLRTVGLALAATAFLPSAVRAATAGFPDSLNPVQARRRETHSLRPRHQLQQFLRMRARERGAQGARQQGLENRTVDDRNWRSLQQAGQV